MTPEEVVQAVTQQAEGMTRPVYRGQADADWQPQSGAVRRLQDAHGGDILKDERKLLNLVTRYHTDQLILPMEVIDGAKLSDLQRLSRLQHQGAATGLLDFTEYPLVALWFACMEMPHKDAKVFMLDIGDPQVAQNVRKDDRMLENPFGFDTGQKVWYYEPDHSLGARIVAQRSVFVICNPLIPDQRIKSVVVPQESKGPLWNYLKRLGLSSTALFGDIPGLAAANTTRTPLKPTSSRTPRQHRERGNLAYQEGRYDEALTAYKSYTEAEPGEADPYCLMGDTHAALGKFKEADLDYTKAIAILERPIDPDQWIGASPKPSRSIKCRALYYNRGNVRAANNDHHRAVADFDMALQHGVDAVGPERDILRSRGNSKFTLEMFAEAYRDFEATWLKIQGSDAALAMGNCKVKMGEFKEALEQYKKGIAVEPEESAVQVVHCRKNAEQVEGILKALHGCDFVVRYESGIVFVETKSVRENSILFTFIGNKGNTGNVSIVIAHGGPGYRGMDGFGVVIS